MLPLAAAIDLAEQAAAEHGPDIANGKSPRHHAAWRVFKQRLEHVDELWEERKAAVQSYLSFSELQTLDRELKDWQEALCNAAMHWVQWSTYSRPAVHKQTRDLLSSAQELEKRLHASSAERGPQRKLQEVLDHNDELRRTSAGDSRLLAGDGQWKPPHGYVGTKTIRHDVRFRKRDKNPQPSTIQRWVERAAREDKPVKIVKAPDTGENFYPEAWIAKQIERWSPRSTPSSVPAG